MDLNFYVRKGVRRAGRVVTNATFRLPSHLSRRKPDHWVFGSSFDKFDGNPKYLFLWVLRHHPEIKATWVTGSNEVHSALSRQGLPSVLRWSPEGMKRTLDAKVAVFADYASDVNVALLGGATLVNLWHGVGIKGIEHLSTLGGPRSRILKKRRNPLAHVAFLERFLEADGFLSTSPTMTRHFADCFRLPLDRFFEAGYPRQDGAIDERLRLDATPTAQMESVDVARHEGKRVLLYMPTWRNTGRPFLESAFPDPARLDDALERANAILFVKLHHHTGAERDAFLRRTRNVQMLPQGSDPYVVLPVIDCLITDYSSVLYDYIQHRDAGVLLYSFDEDRYFSTDQSIVMPFEDNVIGARARDFDAFCRNIETGEAFAALHAERLAALRKRFWETSSAPASPIVVRRIIEMSSAPAGVAGIRS